MKNFVICLFISAVTFLLGFNFYSYSSVGIAESEVLTVMNELHAAEQNKDEEKLKQILADEISWSRYRDQRFFTKQQAIENIDNFEFEHISTETEFVSTEIENNQVKVYFMMKQTFVGEDDKPFVYTAHYTYLFEKQHDRWKLTSIHLEN